MEGYQPVASFGEDAAEIYDATSQRGDEEATVAFLERMADGGRVLELAIGTGRIALPLAARGVDIDGIDIAPAMVAKLRAKPGGEQISVTMGNFADVPVTGSYRLIYVVFNTLFNLLTQDEQVRCFENVATHLTEDGSFVVEALVPADLFRLRNDQYVDAEAIGVGDVRLDVGRHDAVNQILNETHVHLSGDGVRLYPIVTRYAWPSELDLMARIAGLRLRDRWSGWNGEPFTSTSARHVSVYGR
ncbi:MAG: class I SAM-dependent methyltransferase [Ilumatobacteraceae bacterium]|nr:class I SAM-dependent methyltransferase [Ilumatobacteraceae bacterium]